MIPYRTILLFAVCVFLSACSPQSETSGHSFRVFEEAGVTIAETTGGPKYEGELFRYEKYLEIREDPDQPDSFMRDMVMPHYGYDGRYYFVEVNASRILVFDADGSYQMSIGRPGDGPGDLRTPFVCTFHGGFLNVPQNRPPRITRFDTDGTLLDIVTVSDPDQSQYNSLFDLTADGRPLIFYFVDDRGEQFNTRTVGVIALNTEGDTTASVLTPRVKVEEYVPISGGARTSTMPLRINYAGIPCAGYSPHHGLMVSAGLEPEVVCYDLHGRLTRKMKYSVPFDPVTADDRKAIDDEYLQMIGRYEEELGPDSRLIEQFRQFRQNARFAEVKPHWGWFGVDEEGWIWLHKRTQEVVDYEGPLTPRHMIMDNRGEVIGETTFPAGYTAVFSHDRIIVEHRDEETGDRVWVVYLIRSAIDGFVYPARDAELDRH
ncbi:6-bladed beta-propeller [Gemmatimonadota bacterium]